ncbi:aminoglycoside phosphotransferase family protein (plasmid) [Streptomyces sp. NBC_01456]|uniref:aminoglycoside phosphotransferase family protein n=1 Tax=unclassified Streptomyces TaxID=2593676 RepID=UPI002E3243CF|nr:MULTISPECIES: aminoglycoside phosphotransferase family protein [unclassified Streptomyces]
MAAGIYQVTTDATLGVDRPVAPMAALTRGRTEKMTSTQVHGVELTCTGPNSREIGESGAMQGTEGEEPLSGGRITPGVVRVGDTVRRPVTARSAFVAELLGHLEARGCTGAPRYLGLDDSGRDTFSYLPGRVPTRFQTWSNEQVAVAGLLLRSLHEATRGSRLAAGHPVVCHHDPGPNNVVFRNDRPAAFIDFDTAAPGHPLEDLGYMAWTWCVSSKPQAPHAHTQAAQVRILADAYGLYAADRADLLDAMLDRQARNADWWRQHLDVPEPRVADDEQIRSRIAWSLREHSYTAANRSVFAKALR